MRIILWIAGAFVALFLGFFAVGLIAGLPWWNIFWGLAFIGIAALWVLALQDIWRRSDLSRAAATVWTVGVIIFPLFGTLAYYFSRPPASEVRYRGETLS